MPDLLELSARFDDLLDAADESLALIDRQTLYERIAYMLETRRNKPHWRRDHARKMGRPASPDPRRD